MISRKTKQKTQHLQAPYKRFLFKTVMETMNNWIVQNNILLDYLTYWFSFKFYYLCEQKC